MTDRWHRTADLVGLPGMPKVQRPIRLHGTNRGWVSREVAWGKRTRLEWLESSLPPATQAALRSARGDEGGEATTGTSSQGPGSPPTTLLLDNDAAAIADARREILKAFDSWRSAQGKIGVVAAMRKWAPLYKVSGASVSDAVRDLIPTVSWSTLQRWRSAYITGGFDALVRGSGGRASTMDLHPGFRRTAEAEIADRWPHVTARQIQRAIRAKHLDVDPPSIASIRRWVRAWHAVPANRRKLSAVTDPDGHRSTTTPAFGSAAEDITALNQLWELDSTPADVICADGHRYSIVCAIDVWSRRTKCLVARQSKSTAIAALLRRCLIDWGVPEIVRTDEGKDYTSRHVLRILDDLDVAPDILPPYSPDKKPFIERFIGTISRDLFTTLLGFIGHDVVDRKRIEGRKSFAARRSDSKQETYRCDLSAEDLQKAIDQWCDNVYGRETHSEIGMSPFEMAATWAGPIKAVDERALDILLAPPPTGKPTRVVGKKGISVGGGKYIAAELGARIGEEFNIRLDPADYGRVYVLTVPRPGKPMKFVCVAEDPLRTGIDRQEVAKAAKRRSAEANKKAREWARDLMRTEAHAIDAVLAQASKDAGAVVAFPRPREKHSTHGIDAAVAASKATPPGYPGRSVANDPLMVALQKIHGGKPND